MAANDLRRIFRRVLTSQRLDKVAFRIYTLLASLPCCAVSKIHAHEVKVYGVVYKVVLAGLEIWRCREVDSVVLAQRFDLIVRSWHFQYWPDWHSCYCNIPVKPIKSGWNSSRYSFIYHPILSAWSEQKGPRHNVQLRGCLWPARR